MGNTATVEALTAVVKATTPWDTFQALTHARHVLGDGARDFWPLLELLARRQTELERLKRLAGCDAMTGVANRRAFEESLEREVARHARTGEHFAVILLDLDGLKERNDTHGHAAGDEAILAMAQACSDVVRGTDLVARLGGDEFAVLLPGSDIVGARRLAHRLQKAVEGAQVAHEPLRTSIGVAAADGETQRAEGVVAAADEELYLDKARRKSSAPSPQPAASRPAPASARPAAAMAGHGFEAA